MTSDLIEVGKALAPFLGAAWTLYQSWRYGRNEKIKAEAREQAADAAIDQAVSQTVDELWRRVKVLEDGNETLRKALSQALDRIKDFENSHVAVEQYRLLETKVNEQATEIGHLQGEISQLKGEKEATTAENQRLIERLLQAEKTIQVLEIEKGALQQTLALRQ